MFFSIFLIFQCEFFELCVCISLLTPWLHQRVMSFVVLLFDLWTAGRRMFDEGMFFSFRFPYFLCFAYYLHDWGNMKLKFVCFYDLLQTDTLNPFEISNGQFFGSDGFDSTTATNTNGIYMENKELYNFSTSQEETKQELADLRRQVVYLQVFARLSQFSFLYKFDRILFLRLIIIVAIKYFGTHKNRWFSFLFSFYYQHYALWDQDENFEDLQVLIFRVGWRTRFVFVFFQIVF